MRVLLLCNLVPGKAGAFEAFIGALGRDLRAAGHTLALVVAGSPIERVAFEWAAAGVTWNVAPGWTGPDGDPHPWGIIRPGLVSIRSLRPDVVAVHFGNELPTAFLALAARRGCHGIRWFWHQHQQMAPPKTLGQRHASRIRLISPLMTKIVALYEGGRSVLQARGVSENRSCVVPNGTLEPRRTQPTGWLKRLLNVAPETRLVTNVSSLIPRKRVDLTLRAFAMCVGQGLASSRLVVVGCGPEEAPLCELARDLGIAGQVSFLGRRDDVADILAESDVVCLSSDAEACPYVLLEAMALARPCVATDAGAAREIIIDGQTGWVVSRGDAGALATRLRELLEDRAGAAAFGREGRRRWEACFTLERQVARLVALYEGRGMP